jgi:hypothetical protein
MCVSLNVMIQLTVSNTHPFIFCTYITQGCQYRVSFSAVPRISIDRPATELGVHASFQNILVLFLYRWLLVSVLLLEPLCIQLMMRRSVSTIHSEEKHYWNTNLFSFLFYFYAKKYYTICLTVSLQNLSKIRYSNVYYLRYQNHCPKTHRTTAV